MCNFEASGFHSAYIASDICTGCLWHVSQSLWSGAPRYGAKDGFSRGRMLELEEDD